MGISSINTNIAAYSAQQNISKATSMSASSIARLSSGNRIAKASDDVAAMAVGTTLRATVSTLKVGLANASAGTSMLQVADGALSKIGDMLTRQKALATQATSGSLTTATRSFLDQEFQNLTQEIDRVVQNTNFNGVKMLDGTLGSKGVLVATDAMAALLSTAGGLAASTTAVQAFNVSTGATAAGNTAGLLRFVDGAGAILTNSGYQNVNTSVYGTIGKFEISNQVDAVSASVKTTINGVEFTGTVAHNATSMTLSNGNTRIEFGTAAFALTTSGVAQVSLNTLQNSFANVKIMRTQQVPGVNFSGTALAGVTGTAGAGTPLIRKIDGGNTSVSNFQYITNTAAANTNEISVQVGGETYTATGVTDAIANTTVLTFTNGKQEGLQMTLTGLTTAITNIRTSTTDRSNFINALNVGFSQAAGGVDFAVGTQSTDKLTVAIKNSSSGALFGGQALNVNTIADATNAGSVLNTAIDTVTSIRASVGALQSRFDYASANIEISIQNQDAARGTLVDTDISAESTAYATSQVQLQAGISVLAQANQASQQLLKLLG
jgi:flagellin